MKNRISKGFVILILVGFLMMILAHISGTKNQIERYDAQQMVEVQPDSVEQVQSDIRRMHFSRDQFLALGDTIGFYTANQFVEVSADNVIVYRLNQGNPHFGHTPGSLWNFVTIPDDTQEIEVVVTGAYPSTYDREVNFFFGNGALMYSEIIRNSVTASRVSLMVIIMGVVMMAYWCIVSRKTRVGMSMFYLGVFSIIMGLWSYGETDVAALINNNRQASTFAAFVLLMMMPIPFCLFAKEFLQISGDIIWKILIGLCILNGVASVCMEVMEIKDFKQTVFTTHLMIILALIYMVVAIAYKWYKEGFTNLVRLNVIGIAIIAFSTIADLVSYYVDTDKVDSIGRIGFFLYILMIGMETASVSLAQIDEGKKAVFYKELAITDGLTGLMNRNAYNQIVEKMQEPKNVAVVALDLNELKRCNDSQGHAVGDKYITDAAAIISKIFAPYGECFRIGGDEFTVVIEQAQECNIDRMLVKMQAREKEYNQRNGNISMAIACGYAVYDAELDHDLHGTINRADAAMYHNKKQMKEQ